MKVYLVGGALRDELLGRQASDRDYLAAKTSAQELLALGYKRVGRDLSVFLHPDSGEEYTLLNSGLREELRRRDLTINAMARNLETGELIDPFQGKRDLESKTLRHTSERFQEDPVRILRLARFKAKFPDFSIAPETEALCLELLSRGNPLAAEPMERVFQEMRKAMLLPDPAPFFEVLKRWQALWLFLPELRPVYSDALAAMREACRLSDKFPVRFAALLSELGLEQAQLALQRLRPDAYSGRLVLKSVRLQSKLDRLFELEAQTILETLKKLNALGQGDLFEDALIVRQAGRQGKNPQDRFPQAAYWREICQQLKSLSIKDLTVQSEGKELGELVQSRQLATIEGFKARPSWQEHCSS